ncbi:MAG: sigma-70 family RNA polymerase sigma factor [bacterium]
MLNFAWNFSRKPVSFQEATLNAEELFDKYSAMVYNLALRLSGNPNDAQDIAQDAFIKAIRGLQDLRDQSAAGTWLYRITMNVWKNRVRTEKRRFAWKIFSLDWLRDGDDEPPPLQIPSGEASPDAAMEKDSEKAILEKCLSELAPEDRAILVLREIDSRSYQEIAGITGIPLGTVKSRISRARESLRQKLSPDGRTDGT